MWRRAFVLALAPILVAGPALAQGGRFGHRARARPHVTRYVQHHHVHRHPERVYVDAGDAFLWLGLTAIGITAINAWSQDAWARQRYEPRYVEPYPSASVQDDGRRVVFADRSVTPIGDVYLDEGEYCREYQTEVEIGGRLERAWGTACLQPDGSWATR